MERRKFTREFKLEAVRLIKNWDVSFAQELQDLGVHDSQLHSWVKVLADDPQYALPGQHDLHLGGKNPLVFQVSKGSAVIGVGRGRIHHENGCCPGVRLRKRQLAKRPK